MLQLLRDAQVGCKCVSAAHFFVPGFLACAVCLGARARDIYVSVMKRCVSFGCWHASVWRCRVHVHASYILRPFLAACSYHTIVFFTVWRRPRCDSRPRTNEEIQRQNLLPATRLVKYAQRRRRMCVFQIRRQICVFHTIIWCMLHRIVKYADFPALFYRLVPCDMIMKHSA